MVWKTLVQQLLKLGNFELIRKIYHSIPWNSLNMNSLMIPAWKNGAQESEPEPDSNEVNASARTRLWRVLVFLWRQNDDEPRIALGSRVRKPLDGAGGWRCRQGLPEWCQVRTFVYSGGGLIENVRMYEPGTIF